MNDKNYTTNYIVPQTPDEVFAAINNVRGWWSEDVIGDTDKQGATFHYGFRDIHRTEIAITEITPSRRVVWHVVKNYFNFTQDETEWTGTDIVFEIEPDATGTKLTFTHIGLVPHFECFDVCSNGWGTYINGSLKALITTGEGHPNEGEPLNDSEAALSA
ncbi:Activator of Hsp90 ATPase homolog 1-like protein [Devosia sp. YR412]|uniref:SRPBCC family protein n=1 Tax=Devosia sp. YR412 TaxID=1881030 RepID=UPI0008B8BAFF|nr:SRPBCC domain-containing protein [Devosia sp. YR412]SEP81271.1 Activator of Hsp90 ATPase homolog 1-like protein [Devosia sp. YR412]